MRIPSTFLAIFLLLLFAFSCTEKKQVRDPKPMPESAQAYVSAYTEGLISRTSTIAVEFAANVVDESALNLAPKKGVVEMKPAVDGQWQWENNRRLVFKAENHLDFDSKHLISVHLDQLFDAVPEDAKLFEFAVQTRPAHLGLAVGNMNTPQIDEPSKQELKGVLKTSDHVDAESVKKLLTATQKGKELPIEWTQNSDATRHTYVVKDIERGKAEGQVTLNWSGESIGAEQKGTEKVEVPALGVMRVTKIEAIGGEEAVLHINFSDPLKSSQQFDGLITVSESENNFKYIVEKNVLKVHLQQSLAGEHRVTVHAGIQNHYKGKLDKTSIWDLSFTAIEPQLRLVGSGNILSGGEELLMPFEAINIHEVELEVFKIYNNNILQFLQTNDVNGNNNLNRVGKVILRQTVELNELNNGVNKAQWNRYALNLKDFFDADPKAIYQVRLGFRQSGSFYPCENTEQDFNFTESGYDASKKNSSIMNTWYGINGYYTQYSWRHRDDPCFPAYYNSDRFLVNNVLSSNLGIIAKGTDELDYLFAVTDLRTTKPVAGVELKAYNYQQQLIATAKTNADGIARIKTEEDGIFVLTASTKDDQGFLKMLSGNALSLSRFDVSGQRPKKGLKGFIYGERGVWRPGDSIFLNFILEDQQGSLPADYPISFEIRDNQGNLRVSRSDINPIGDIYPLYFKTSTDDITGLWRAKVSVGSAVFSKSIRVETVKPNRLKSTYDFADESIIAENGTLTAQLQGNWLHGAPAKALKSKVSFTYRRDYSGFKTFKGYRFIPADYPSSNQEITAFDDHLDEGGRATIDFELPRNDAMPYAGPYKLQVRTRIFEKGGDFSTQREQLTFHPYEHYAGVSIPKNKYGSARLYVDQASTIGLAAVDTEGKGLANEQLNVKIYKVEWRWWWDEDADRSNYNRNRNSLEVLSERKKTDKNGRANVDFTPDRWGRYLVEVCSESNEHCASAYVYAGSPWYNEQSYSEEASMLTFLANKESYEVGEEVELSFPAGENGSALLSLETVDGVVQTHWIETQGGDNTYRFKTTAEMAPSVYAFLTVLQPQGQESNDLPLRSYGVIHIKVTDRETLLEPIVKMADKLKPDENFTVEVKEKDGIPMTYTLAVVDEGLLSLTNFKTPNPHGHFFAREALGVRTWDMYRYVLGGANGEMGQILSIGGDGDLKKGQEGDQANRFKPVVMHLGPFTLAANETAKHDIKMPNYIGAVRTMVVAANHYAYGSTEKSTPVRKPLMVLATLPRVLGVGEELDLPVNVFAMRKQLGKVRVRIEESSGLVNILENNKQLNFSAMGDEIVRFPIKTKLASGVARFKIIAEGGGESSTQEIEIDIRNPNPIQVKTEPFALNAGEERSMPFNAFGTAGSRSATLEVTNFPPLGLEKRLNYLIGYPYGCIEQTTSRAFPQLYLDYFIELNDSDEKEVRHNVQAAVNRLRRFQLANGAMSYWPGSSKASMWGTNYAGNFLLAAKERGYVVPDNMLDAWINFQTKTAKEWNATTKDNPYIRRGNYELDQAYRLYLLAKAGKPQLGAMNRMKETDLHIVSKWRLAAAYALIGQTDVARKMIRNTSYEVEDYRELSYTYGSNIRDRAMILETLILLDQDEAVNKTILYLSKRLNAGEWMSTQEIAYSLMVMSKYLGDQKDNNKHYTFSYQQAGAKMVDAGSDHPYMQIELDPDKEGQILVKNTSSQKLFANLIYKGKALPEEEFESASFVGMDIAYFDADGNTTIDPTQLKQGTDFIARITLKHTGELNYRFEEMALEQIFPAGWEITNTRFENLNNTTNDNDNIDQSYEYKDYRDDRIHTFFDLYRYRAKQYDVRLTAAYAGRYYLPATRCQAMYDNSIYASSKGHWIEVVQ